MDWVDQRAVGITEWAKLGWNLGIEISHDHFDPLLSLLCRRNVFALRRIAREKFPHAMKLGEIFKFAEKCQDTAVPLYGPLHSSRE